VLTGDDVDYAGQDATPNGAISAASARPLAPPESAIHEEFVRAAAEGQHTARLRYLLAQGANIDSWDSLLLSALYYSACRGDLENVRFLLSSGADVNWQHQHAGTAISIAALRGHADVVEALSSHKANLVAGRGAMGSAIHCACFNGNITIVKSLLDRGASLDREAVVNI
jgi:ankyrin repeat protein